MQKKALQKHNQWVENEGINRVAKLEQDLAQMSIDSKEGTLKIAGHHLVLDSMQRDLLLMNSKVNQFSEEITKTRDFKSKHDSYDAANERFTKDIQLIRNRIDELETELRKTDNYIEFKMPYDLMNSVGEVMDYTVSRKSDRVRLTEYMSVKIKEIIENIKKSKGWTTKYKDFNSVDTSEFKWFSKLFKNNDAISDISSEPSNKNIQYLEENKQKKSENLFEGMALQKAKEFSEANKSRKEEKKVITSKDRSLRHRGSNASNSPLPTIAEGKSMQNFSSFDNKPPSNLKNQKIPKISVTKVGASNSSSQGSSKRGSIKSKRKGSLNVDYHYNTAMTISIERSRKDSARSSRQRNVNLPLKDDFGDAFDEDDFLMRKPSNQLVDIEDIKEQLLPLLELDKIEDRTDQKLQDYTKSMEEFAISKIDQLKEEIMNVIEENRNLITDQYKDYSHNEDLILETTLRNYIANDYQILQDQLKEIKIEQNNKFDKTNEYINNKNQDILIFIKEEIKRRNRGHSDMMMVIEVIKNKNIEILKEFESIESAIFNIAEIVPTIVELLSLNNVL